jgi:hypothetical protein
MAVTKKPRPLKFYLYTCDLESERSVSWGSNCIIFTKDSNKWWKVVNGEYVETTAMAVGVSLSDSYSWGGGGNYDGNPATIQQNENYRFTTDAEKTAWNGKAAGNHDHNGVYQPAGNYAASNHNHDASYAALNHNHDASYAALNHTHNGLPTYARVTNANATTTGQALADIAGLSQVLLANSVYEFEAVLEVQSSSTAGNGYGVNFSAAGATVEGQIQGTLTATSDKTLRINTLNAAASPYVTINGTGAVNIKGIITVGANAGTLTIKHLKVTSGTATVFINSYLKVTKVA